MKPKIFIQNNKEAMARAIADGIVQLSIQAIINNRNVYLALSGGSTPRILFEMLAKEPYSGAIDWDYFHLFWGDERCVPADHADSNYGMTAASLLDHINIPSRNVHRLIGEADPESEATRYAREMKALIPLNENGLPRFDWVFLGMGSDGHTASLFPDTEELNNDEDLCIVARHPQSGQKRISFTLPLINAASRISFLVTGGAKHQIADTILRQREGYQQYPAAMVAPTEGQLEWYLDKDAANMLEES